jgi:hypothetical protein
MLIELKATENTLTIYGVSKIGISEVVALSLHDRNNLHRKITIATVQLRKAVTGPFLMLTEPGCCLCGGNDCNDSGAAINPGTAEVLGNGTDENCNGTSDDTCLTCEGGT